MADDQRLIDYLAWTPIAGATAFVGWQAIKRGEHHSIRAAWQHGRRISTFIDRLATELSDAAQKYIRTLPTDLTLEQEQFIIDLAKRQLGTQVRLSHVHNFADLERVKTKMPEFYHSVVDIAHQLKNVDPNKILRGEVLEKTLLEQANIDIGTVTEIVKQEYIDPRRLSTVLNEIENARPFGGPVATELRSLHRAFETVTGGKASFYLIRRKVQGQDTPIAARFVRGRYRLEVPLLTPEGYFVSRSGAASFAAWWHLPGGVEVPPDIYIAQRAAEALQENPDPANLKNVRELIARLRGKSVFAAHERALEGYSPIAGIFMRGRAIVEHESTLDIPQRRQEAAKWAFKRGLDITTGTPPSASANAMVFKTDFDIRKFTLSGGIADDKIYKTFARAMPLSESAILNLQRLSGRVTHLHHPAAAPIGYYEAARTTGEKLLNLNYGTIQPKQRIGTMEIDVIAELERIWNESARRRRERILSLETTADEIFAASSIRRLWSTTRLLDYELLISEGINQEVFDALKKGQPLRPGTFLGISPIGQPVFSGHRGGYDIITGFERIDENKIKIMVRNLVYPEPGTKIFGTGGLKHTIRGFINPKRLQALYAYYLRRFEGLPGHEARHIARSISALTIHKGFKHPEQEVEQWLAQLANLETKLSASPREADRRLASEAADWLQRFGFKRADDQEIARWVRHDYSGLSPREIADVFQAEVASRPQSVLAKAQKWANLIRSEFIRMGPPPEDLGVGQRATMSLEMLSRSFDQPELTKTAAHLMARTGVDKAVLLRGLEEMLKPFSGGGHRYGTHIHQLNLAQITPGEYGVADWLNRWSSIFPKEGIIHFRPYRLSTGQIVSYLSLPQEPVRQLQGVWLDEGQNAASIWQRSLYNALEAIHSDISGAVDSPAYERAVAALEDYYKTLQNLTVGKTAAMREALRGRLTHSMQFQAASMPARLAQTEPEVVMAPISSIRKMLSGLTPEVEQQLLQKLYQGKGYRSLIEALERGETMPAMMWRFPGEEVHSAMPVRLQAKEALEARIRQQTGRPFKLPSREGQLFINEYLFKLAMGDFDADPVHLAPILSAEALEETKNALDRGYTRRILMEFNTMRQAADPKSKPAWPGWTDTLDQVLGRLVQQTAGKADVGIISNALYDITEATRMAGQPELASWAPIIAESLTIKAKHATPSQLLEIHRPQELVAHIRGTGLGMDIDTRTQYLLERVKLVAPEESWVKHAENIRRALEIYDQAYKGSPAQTFSRNLRRLPGTAGPHTAEGLWRYITNIFQPRPLGAHILHGAKDDFGLISRIGGKLAPVVEAGQQLLQVAKRHSGLLLGAAAIGAGISMLRPTRDLTPESVTGDELDAQRQERRLPEQTPVLPSPTARIANRYHGISMQGRGRVTRELSPNTMQASFNSLPAPPAQVIIRDERRRWTREEIRELQKRIK